MKRVSLASLSLAVTLAAGTASGTLPPNFPGITVTTNSPADVGAGKIFLAVATSTYDPPTSTDPADRVIGYHLMILENDGSPLWHHELADDYAYDFKALCNGYLHYAQLFHHHDYTGGGDAMSEIIDGGNPPAPWETIGMADGYLPEAHAFQLLPNGHVLQMGYYMSEFDMSGIVDGGHPAARVSGGIIQELDTSSPRRPVWQWRNWDHNLPEDYAWRANRARGEKVSAWHINSIRMDHDGNLLWGSPSRAQKVDRATGEIMWTIDNAGGDFTFLGEVNGVAASGGHLTGHTFHRIENGNVLAFDNGRGTNTAQVHEYQLDEINRTATLVWTWQPETTISAWHRGSAQRLPNGNTLIGWGGASGEHIPACTEVKPDGTIAFELYFDDLAPLVQVESYRAFRAPWPPESVRLSQTQDLFETGTPLEFIDRTSGEPLGVSLYVNSLLTFNYYEMTVEREPYAPVIAPGTGDFPGTGKAPRLLPERVWIDIFGLNAVDMEVSFDVASFGITNPGAITIYRRPTRGTGSFSALPTSYNPVTGSVRTDVGIGLTELGEFVLGYPDLADSILAPILHMPENDRGPQTQEFVAPRRAEDGMTYDLNQERDVRLSWSPRGLVRQSQIQIDTDPGFPQGESAAPVQDLALDAFSYSFPATHPYFQPDTTYHYRVRTVTDGQVPGAWAAGSFRTVPPAISVTAPAGPSNWQTGIRYFITWDKNLAGDVQIDLYRNGSFVQNITTASTYGAYNWECELGLTPGTGYEVRVTSVDTSGVLGVSQSAFTIDVPEISGIVRQTNGQFVIEWEGSSAPVALDFSSELESGVWQNVGGPESPPVTGITNSPPPSGDAVGFYQLRVD